MKLHRDRTVGRHPRGGDAPSRAGAENLGRLLARDREHGATELVRRALQSLAPYCRATSRLLGAEERRSLRGWGEAVRRAQPSMAALVQLGEQVTTLSRGTGELRRALLRSLRARWSSQLALEQKGLPQVFRRRFRGAGRPLLTLSRSESVLRALQGLPADGRPSTVQVLRSLPGGEGAQLARDLRHAGLSVRLWEDRDYARALLPGTTVLLGADAVLPDGDLIHKRGTRVVARLARRRRLPVIVLCGSSKILRRAPRSGHRWRGPFDRTPSSWITEVWTERGRWRPPDQGRSH